MNQPLIDFFIVFNLVHYLVNIFGLLLALIIGLVVGLCSECQQKHGNLMLVDFRSIQNIISVDQFVQHLHELDIQIDIGFIESHKKT